MVGVDETILLQQVRRRRHRGPEGQAAGVSGPAAAVGTDPESYCIALVLKEPSFLELEPRIEERHFGNPAYREILRLVVEYTGTRKGGGEGRELAEWLEGRVTGPLRELLEQLLALESQQPFQFQGPLDKAYQAAAVNLMLGSLSLRRQQLEALVSTSDAEGESVDAAGLARMEQEIAMEAHRLKLLGGILPLRAIHKEVRNGR